MWQRLTWGMADLSDINSMVLNKLRLAERQRTKKKKKSRKKKLLSFLTNKRRTTFITHHRGTDELTAGREAGPGPVWGRTTCINPESLTFRAFGFTEFWQKQVACMKQNIPERRALSPTRAVVLNFRNAQLLSCIMMMIWLNVLMMTYTLPH